MTQPVFRLIPSDLVNSPIRIHDENFPELRTYAERGERLVLVPTDQIKRHALELRSMGATVNLNTAPLNL